LENGFKVLLYSGEEVLHMSGDTKNLFAERLGRYQAAIDLEPTDRIPIATGSNYFAEVYSGNTNQETIYNSEKWLQADAARGAGLIRATPVL
jgi:hypothetical protein